MTKKYWLFFILLTAGFSVSAKIKLPGILCNNMVLQQKSTPRLWGWATPNEKIKITTSWDSKTVEAVADGNATWQVNIQTPPAGGPYSITFEGENKIILENVLMGEVWVCSGQSNMVRGYNMGVSSIKEDFNQLQNLNLRLFNITNATSKTPQDDLTGSWTICDSNSIKAFSAVGYYFARQLNQDLKVPIGIINSSWGGTPAEVWTPAELVENDPLLKEASDKFTPSAWNPVQPGYAYNAMIAPLTNYSIAGAIWYQGESNTAAWQTYTQLMYTMIKGWRKAWHADFPFYYVQIAPFKYANPYVGALLREAQANLSAPQTGMVVISDLVTDTLNIHPTNKKDVGLRLANLALVETYGEKKAGYKSPVFKSFTVDKSTAVISFDHAENGLTIKGESPNDIFIAGADKHFYPAKVKIKGNTIIVSSENVKTPTAVRYQFTNASIGNFFSRSGLPVAPFRTDTWGVDTSKIK